MISDAVTQQETKKTAEKILRPAANLSHGGAGRRVQPPPSPVAGGAGPQGVGGGDTGSVWPDPAARPSGVQ